MNDLDIIKFKIDLTRSTDSLVKSLLKDSQKDTELFKKLVLTDAGFFERLEEEKTVLGILVAEFERRQTLKTSAYISWGVTACDEKVVICSRCNQILYRTKLGGKAIQAVRVFTFRHKCSQ